MRHVIKRLAIVVAKILVWPGALLSGFGRIEVSFRFFAEAFALIPGIVGNYLRAAYYSFTLLGLGRDSYIGTGSWFAHSDAWVGAHVGIGSYCILGSVRLGDRTMVASGAQILSGSGQHARDENGRLTDEGRLFQTIEVGADCWIGALAIVMASLGKSVTVAPGTVVAKAVPDFMTVAGNPARPVREMAMAAHG